MPRIEGKTVVAMGLGRSGLAVARAAVERGARPIVVDEKAEPPKPELVEEARAEGIDVRLGWSGSFDELGADLVVVNPAVDSRHPKLRDLGVELISEVEFASRIARGPIVAITGTNGKSTTCVMTYLALRACGLDPLLCGNLYGSGYPEAPLTEAALVGEEGQPLVAEISSFGLEWTSTFRPRAAAITTIKPDHLDRYDSFEDYAATKMRIFAGQTEDDYAVVRANDPVVVPPCGAGNRYVPRHRRGMGFPPVAHGGDAHATRCPHVLTFGATGEHARVEETELVVLDQRIPLDSFPWTEPHNHANAACAALLAYGLLRAVDSPLIAEALAARPKPSVFAARREEPPALPPRIVAGLREFQGLAHRMELVGVREGVKVVNNSMCTNPDAVVSSALAARDATHLLVGGVDKGLDFTPLGRLLGGGRHRAYLFGRDARQIDAQMGGGFPVFGTMEEAFRAAAANARRGETIMLAPGCASSDQFRDFRDRGDQFSGYGQGLAPKMKRISDPLLFGLCLCATLLGLFTVFDAGYARSLAKDGGMIPHEFTMQVVFLSLAVPLGLVLGGVRLEKWERASRPLWLATILALAAVMVVGVAQNGARRWLGVGQFSLQPAEFAKLAAILYLAACLKGRKSWAEVRRPARDVPTWLDNVAVPKIARWFPFLTVLLGASLIEVEPDLGTAALLVATGFLLLLPGRVSGGSLLLGVAGVALAGTFLVYRQPYRIERFLNHSHRWEVGVADDAGYQTTQSEQGMADGGLTGVGIGRGRAKSFLPATTTDFILATVAEEAGLVGSLGVLALLGAITARLYVLARRAPTEYGSLVLYGICAWFGVQTCTNFMMANGFLPAIGIPLPFFSSGGSSLLALWAAVGVAQAASLAPSMAPARKRRAVAQRMARVR